MAWTSPRTWVASEIVTAALLNTHLRDNLKAIGDAWTSYTPTWTAASSNPTLGNGTIAGRYIQAGKLVLYRIKVTFGSTTTAGTGYYMWTLPVTAIDDRMPCGDVACWDNSATAFDAGTAFTETAQPGIVRARSTKAVDTMVTGSNPFTWATSDEIQIAGMYEAA